MITANVYTKVRGEIAALFGWNVENLSPDQALRVDTATALRLALDHLQGGIVRGESIDITKMLTASEALARLLPPAVLATPPAEQREDHGAAVAPLLKLFRYLHESVHTLTAENATLKARLGEGSAPVPPMLNESVPVNPPTRDIVPPSERAECDAGPRAGHDDPKPRRPGPVIEGVAQPKPPAAPAAPKYDYDKEQGWKDYVLPDGNISPTPIGGGRRWWGPV
jgi:hypothetical protein